MEAVLWIMFFIALYMIAIHYGLKLIRWMFKQ